MINAEGVACIIRVEMTHDEEQNKPDSWKWQKMEVGSTKVLLQIPESAHEREGDPNKIQSFLISVTETSPRKTSKPNERIEPLKRLRDHLEVTKTFHEQEGSAGASLLFHQGMATGIGLSIDQLQYEITALELEEGK